jgi:hypothetical protein
MDPLVSECVQNVWMKGACLKDSGVALTYFVNFPILKTTGTRKFENFSVQEIVKGWWK